MRSEKGGLWAKEMAGAKGKYWGILIWWCWWQHSIVGILQYLFRASMLQRPMLYPKRTPSAFETCVYKTNNKLIERKKSHYNGFLLTLKTIWLVDWTCKAYLDWLYVDVVWKQTNAWFGSFQIMVNAWNKHKFSCVTISFTLIYRT